MSSRRCPAAVSICYKPSDPWHWFIDHSLLARGQGAVWKHCSNLSAFLLKTLRIKALHWWSTCKVLGRTGAVLVSAVSKLDSTYYWLNSTEFILLLCCKAQAAAAGGEMPWFADVDLLQVKQQKNSMSKRLSRTQRYLISSPVTDWTAFYFVCLSPSETLPWDSLVPVCFAALAWLGESFSWPDFCWLKNPWKPPPSQILPGCSNFRSDVPQSIGASAILSSHWMSLWSLSLLLAFAQRLAQWGHNWTKHRLDTRTLQPSRCFRADPWHSMTMMFSREFLICLVPGWSCKWSLESLDIIWPKKVLRHGAS